MLMSQTGPTQQGAAGPVGGSLKPVVQEPNPASANAKKPLALALTGKLAPNTITLAQMPTDWTATFINVERPVPNLLQSLTPEQIAIATFEEAANLCWTDGKPVALTTGDYLVLYKLNIATAADKDLDPRYISFSLNLIRVEFMRTIQPKPEFSKADLAKVVQQYRKAIETLAKDAKKKG